MPCPWIGLMVWILPANGPGLRAAPRPGVEKLGEQGAPAPRRAGVSYGRIFITQKPTLAALVPVGYGDGYHRILSNRGSVLIHGQRAPILGRVAWTSSCGCLAHLGRQQDDEVVIPGSQGDERISARRWPGWPPPSTTR